MKRKVNSWEDWFRDDLRTGYNQLVPGTFFHADELMAEQVEYYMGGQYWTETRAHGINSLIDHFYVADGPLYSLEGKKKTPTLWLTRESSNLVLRHLNDKVNSSYEQFVKNDNFRPDPEEARTAMKAKDTLRIDLTKLHLQVDTYDGKSYLEIPSAGHRYNILNAEERKLAERWFGQGEAFVAAMKMVRQFHIYIPRRVYVRPGTTRVYVLDPDYVSREAKKGPIGRIATRDPFFFPATHTVVEYRAACSYATGSCVKAHIALRGTFYES